MSVGVRVRGNGQETGQEVNKGVEQGSVGGRGVHQRGGDVHKLLNGGGLRLKATERQMTDGRVAGQGREEFRRT